MNDIAKDDESVPTLRACIRDLAALSALPSLWVGREPPQVIDSFLDILSAALRLDLVYARVEEPRGGDTVEAARANGGGHQLPRAMVAEISSLLIPLVGSATSTEIMSPVDNAMLRVAVLPLPTGEGAIFAGCRRATFPTPLESMVLSAALNQITLWLRLTRLLVDTRRVEAKLAERESSHLQLEDENAYLREEVEVALAFGGIVGQSQALRDILAEVELVAPTDATVLVLGESGTGKELLAREIHERSRRAGRPLIKVNCSAIPREMFESEFFGHIRGAFTGAVRDRPGRFKLAEKGTIFLDEVGDLPLDLQPKLLRVLQEGQYERVGDDTTRSIDVRVIAATNRDLSADVSAGRFREDLYYRLSVFPIRIPALRDRKEDIVPLSNHFTALVSKELGTPPPQLTEQQTAALKAYDWPGNVRELQNVIERAVILGRGGEMRLDQVLGHRGEQQHSQRRSSVPPPAPPQVQEEIVNDQEWRRRERANLIAALTRTSGRIYGTGGAAELLGVKPSTLQSRLRALGIRARERA
ncbi:MAG: Fis family transcriptional regulator [Labilithrix sp.]|nr:Fis family transcriptional regulator [Labilithrix sp.]